MPLQADRVSQFLAMQSAEPGEIRQLAHNQTPPRGWDYASGEEYSRALYARLFSKLGTDHGPGNGLTTFRGPNYKGKVPAGRSDMNGKNDRLLKPTGSGASGIQETKVGATGGLDRRSLVASNMPPKVLSLDSAFGTVVGGGVTAGTSGAALYQTTAIPAAISTVQPTIICNYIMFLGRDKVVIPPIPALGYATSNIEFNGPFADWIIATDYEGVDPTGVEDSTAGLQQAIKDVVEHIVIGSDEDLDHKYGAAALFIPAGTYLISETLKLPDDAITEEVALSLHIYGDHPDTTILKWVGEEDGQMMWGAGWHSGVVSRIHFDGNNLADICFRLERDPTIPMSQNFNRLEYCYFSDANYGYKNTIDIPGTGTDSEMSIFVCSFFRIKEYGVQVNAGESYDHWVRQCYFEECENGVGRVIDEQLVDFTQHEGTPGAGFGQYSVYDCIFNGSKRWDIDFPTGETIRVARNASYNSKRFVRLANANLTFESNRVILPIEDDAVHIVTQQRQRPNCMFAKNEFLSRPGASIPVVAEIYDEGLEELIEQAADRKLLDNAIRVYDNRFSVSYDPFSWDPRWVLVLEEDTHINQTIDDSVALRTPIPPNVTRETFYFTDLGNPTSCAAIIADAAEWAEDHEGSRPVIYIPFLGTQSRRKIEETLVFPPNLEMSLQAGGNKLVLNWHIAFDNENDDVPVLYFQGPSKFTLNNIRMPTQFEGNKTGLHIVVDNCDQVGARVSMDNCSSMFSLLDASHVKMDVTDLVWVRGGDDQLPATFTSDAAVAGAGRVLVEGSGGSLGQLPTPEITPFVQVGPGGQVYLREIWYETQTLNQLTFRLLGGTSAQPGWFSVESSRWVQDENELFPPHYNWFNNTQAEIVDWNGQAIFSSIKMVGRLKLLGDTSELQVFELGSGSAAIDDSGRFYAFEGVPLKQIARIFTASPPVGSIGHTEAYLEIPGWPDSYEGDDGDTFTTDDRGHNYVWKDGAFHNLGGIVSWVDTADDLPGTYPNLIEDDIMIARDTMRLWQWDGADWNDLGGGSLMPASYWRYEGRIQGDSSQISQNYLPQPWTNGTPLGESGERPADWKDTIDKMLAPRPVKFFAALADGVTDFSMHRVETYIRFYGGAFELP